MAAEGAERRLDRVGHRGDRVGHDREGEGEEQHPLATPVGRPERTSDWALATKPRRVDDKAPTSLPGTP
jgi:hypothetical protein